ncbi:MAG TPA: methyltransferase domain-containing protein [Anaerolineales bacterium]|nr:methyltransferase domain-containing protein [Anaerolineales bacterium]
MKPQTLSLLCDPITYDPLEVESAFERRQAVQESLINRKTGKCFPIREGIPIFLDDQQVTGSNRKYQSLYDRLAPVYDFSTWAYSRWKGMKVEARLREYLDELEVQDGDRLLEVSVGTGRNLQFLPRSAQYFGLDISWGMLKQCRRNMKRWKLDIALFLGNAEHLPFKEESFDVVFHFGGINFFNDKAAAIREMVRVAKPGTKFVIGDEKEELAERYEKIPVMDGIYGHRVHAITAPLELLPDGMQDVQVKDIAGGDLYCLSFRKPKK